MSTIVSKVTLMGTDDGEVDVLLALKDKPVMYLTVRAPAYGLSNGARHVSVEINRSMAVALSNVLAGWASELPT